MFLFDIPLFGILIIDYGRGHILLIF
uniref:Uncharacterized protein n=1 Tax=Anguilla anguilla TaxID=7936 RepID=A0A0E9Y1E2_ANGAN